MEGINNAGRWKGGMERGGAVWLTMVWSGPPTMSLFRESGKGDRKRQTNGQRGRERKKNKKKRN